MGANATTKVPSYTAGQVLTAADLSITNSGIPVFANATDRANSFGGTGEKTLAEGQYAYLEDVNRTYVYNGSAWVEIVPAGLELITAGSFSGVASWTVDNVFTSAYRNYRVVVHNDQTTGAAAQILSTRLRVGGVESATTYYSSRSGYTYGSVVAADVVSNGTYWFIQRSQGSAEDGESGCSFDLYSPALAVRTYFSGTQVDALYAGGVGGYHATATAYDGIGFGTTTGGTTMTGTYRIYGYRE